MIKPECGYIQNIKNIYCEICGKFLGSYFDRLIRRVQ